MQEVIEEKSVALIIKGAKISGRLLAKAMQKYIKEVEAASKNANKTKQPKRGKQSYSSLVKHGDSLSDVEITDKNIGSFNKTARKYKIDFALKKDKSMAPPRWLVFFKAKDVNTLTAAFKEYSNKILKTKNRKPSMLTKLDKYKELAKTVAAPVKSRNLGGLEL